MSPNFNLFVDSCSYHLSISVFYFCLGTSKYSIFSSCFCWYLLLDADIFKSFEILKYFWSRTFCWDVSVNNKLVDLSGFAWKFLSRSCSSIGWKCFAWGCFLAEDCVWNFCLFRWIFVIRSWRNRFYFLLWWLIVLVIRCLFSLAHLLAFHRCIGFRLFASLLTSIFFFGNFTGLDGRGSIYWTALLNLLSDIATKLSYSNHCKYLQV